MLLVTFCPYLNSLRIATSQLSFFSFFFFFFFFFSYVTAFQQMECDHYVSPMAMPGMKSVAPGGTVAIIRFYGVTAVSFSLL